MRQELETANALFENGRFDDALAEYRKMAEGGSIEAQLRIGWMYQTGSGVKVDWDQARHWYALAAKSNQPQAQFYLGRLYRAQEMFQEAVDCFQKAAEQNHMPSIYQLGVMYKRGEGMNRDVDAAYKYYGTAARMGHLRSQRDMAVLLLTGHLGLQHIPHGILLLVQLFYRAIKVYLEDPDGDRVRW
jgi:TPR repeat protein